MLIDRDLTNKALSSAADISQSSTAIMRRGKTVIMDRILKICSHPIMPLETLARQFIRKLQVEYKQNS